MATRDELKTYISGLIDDVCPEDAELSEQQVEQIEDRLTDIDELLSEIDALSEESSNA